MSPFPLTSLIIAVVMFIAFVLLSIISYQHRFKLPYHIRNCFPFELNLEGKFSCNIYGNIAFAISSLLLGIFYCAFRYENSNGFNVAILVFGLFNVASILCTVFVSTRETKTHICFASILFASALGISVLEIVKEIYLCIEKFSIGRIVIASLCAIIAIIIIIICLNPKLKKWCKYDTVIEDNAISYIRPKYFVLAFSEWSVMFISFILPILLLVSIYL